MTTERMIQLSETAKDLLERIVESRFGPVSGSGLSFLCDCVIEHLIHEEARKLKVTDDFATKGCSRPQTSVSADQNLEGKE